MHYYNNSIYCHLIISGILGSRGNVCKYNGNGGRAPQYLKLRLRRDTSSVFLRRTRAQINDDLLRLVNFVI